MELELVEKLENFIRKNPEAADAKTINLSTAKEFTLRKIYEELKKEKETGIAIVDPEIIEVKSNIKEWLKEV